MRPHDAAPWTLRHGGNVERAVRGCDDHRLGLVGLEFHVAALEPTENTSLRTALPNDAAWSLAGRGAVFPDAPAGDPDAGDPVRRARRVGVGSRVEVEIGVEQDEVGPLPGLDAPAIGEAEAVCSA